MDKEFLVSNPQAVVLHLGCGLDSRVYRVNPSPAVLWFDVDYPDIIELRQRLYPEREGYQMIGSSVTDAGWLDQIPKDHPALVVAEGLLYYLKDDEVKALVKRIVDRFPSGQVLFDGISRLYLKFQKTNVGISATGSKIWWGLDDVHELEEWSPGSSCLQMVCHVTGFSQHPEDVQGDYVSFCASCSISAR